MISVVMPTYNRGYILERSIKSVLNQTYKDLELIIVDDNSNDNTEEIIKSIKDNRIRYIKQKENLGANKARNRGICESRGDLIAFQDSDDEWLPNKLEIQIRELKKKKSDLVFCSFNRFENDKKEIIPNKNINESNIQNELLHGNFISTQTILAKKACFLNEKFDDRLPRFQDWDLMIRISLNYKITFIDQPLVNVYVQHDSISKDREKAEQSIKIMLEKYKVLINNNKNIIEIWYKIMMMSSGNIKNKTKYLKVMVLNKPYNLKNLYIYFKSCIGVILNRFKAIG